MHKLFLENIFRNFSCKVTNPVTISHYNMQDNYSTNASTFYEALGVQNKATQAEIKEAYYRLSLKFHPDRNKGSEEAVIRFREISEAYEILGNYVLRKRYDKGLLQPLLHQPSKQDKDDNREKQQYKKFYESRKFQSRPLAPKGRSNIYNFDEFYAQHYSEQFSKNSVQARIKERKKRIKGVGFENITVIFVGMIGLGGIILHSQFNREKRKEVKSE